MFFQTLKKKIPQQAKATANPSDTGAELGGQRGAREHRDRYGLREGTRRQVARGGAVLEHLAVRILKPSQEAWGLLGLRLPQRG